MDILSVDLNDYALEAPSIRGPLVAHEDDPEKNKALTVLDFISEAEEDLILKIDATVCSAGIIDGKPTAYGESAPKIGLTISPAAKVVLNSLLEKAGEVLGVDASFEKRDIFFNRKWYMKLKTADGAYAAQFQPHMAPAVPHPDLLAGVKVVVTVKIGAWYSFEVNKKKQYGLCFNAIGLKFDIEEPEPAKKKARVSAAK